MGRLFIIGNGFDLAHGIPSTFNHFKEYLRSSYLYDYNVEPNLWITAQTMPDGDQSYNSTDCAQIIDYMVSESFEDAREDWSDFEVALGNLDYTLLEGDIEIQYDREGDIHPSRTRYNYEDAYSDFSNVMSNLPSLFSDWVNEIAVPTSRFSVFNLNTHQKISELINESDIFFTFNYTDTLETLYEMPNVLHIHGDKTNPIVGHCKDSHMEERAYFQDEYINTMADALKKPTAKIIEENKVFFGNLDEINSIYSYGFSFGNVDLVYVKEIIQHIDTKKITWYLHSFNEEDHVDYIRKIRKCGFKGNFGLFN